MEDIEIARKSKIEDIKDIAKKLGLSDKKLYYYGKHIAKITSKTNNKKDAKLILVTAINPTPLGEGKTTISIGLADALNLLKKETIVVLREPSLGPVFGIKGGATGGGKAQVNPMEDINLHFTGDFHAITSANNLLAAAIDNHIKQGNELNIDINNITFHRCMDMNDRALRDINIGLGGSINGTPREDHFDITAASEVMTIFCLSKDLEDLKTRLGNIIIGYNIENKPIYAKDLKVNEAMTILLKNSFFPNLVQTLENNPAIIHGGPFANIAHGCNSIVATKLALGLSDYVVTEAGFGADLGAFKFLDIKCNIANIKPQCVVLVATVKALKYNGGVNISKVNEENIKSLEKGICNLDAHIDNLEKLGMNVVVCLNKYDNDKDNEIDFIKKYCENRKVLFEVSTSYKDGGKGAINLANKVLKAVKVESNIKRLYNIEDKIENKINVICKNIYGATDIEYSDVAKNKIKLYEQNNLLNKLICISKTQYSLSDDPNKLGRPNNYTMHIKDIRIYNGAGFITVLTGDIMTMPGLSKEPAYKNMKIENNKVYGLY